MKLIRVRNENWKRKTYLWKLIEENLQYDSPVRTEILNLTLVLDANFCLTNKASELVDSV